jgi:hypothetical protein
LLSFIPAANILRDAGSDGPPVFESIADGGLLEAGMRDRGCRQQTAGRWLIPRSIHASPKVGRKAIALHRSGWLRYCASCWQS